MIRVCGPLANRLPARACRAIRAEVSPARPGVTRVYRESEGRWGWRVSLSGRCALILGISGPDPGLGEPELGAPAPLANAPAQAEALAASLAGYGYRDVLGATGNRDTGIAVAADVQVRLDAALAEPGLVVVHLLTHGLQGPGQGVLYVLGPDGAEVEPSVGEWINRAEKRGGDCGPVLFVLDVCHAGAAVEYQLKQMVDARRRQAWVLAASSGADPAYDGRLTHAITQVLEGSGPGSSRWIRQCGISRCASCSARWTGSCGNSRRAATRSRSTPPRPRCTSTPTSWNSSPTPAGTQTCTATTPAARWPLAWLRCWIRPSRRSQYLWRVLNRYTGAGRPGLCLRRRCRGDQ